jgi:uncharacterized protein (DUF1501 family)
MTQGHPPKNSPRLSRRALLAQGSALLGATTAGLAQAQTADPYKALVCVFLLGGNDGHNMVVPLEPTAYAAYRSIRGGLALPDVNTQLLPVQTPQGVPYGLNNGLQAIAPLWPQGRLAVLANVGMLAQPVTRAQVLAGNARLPSNLFSHSDQIVQMQTGDANGSGGTGWGGRSMDRVLAMNGSSRFPGSVSMDGSALFCAGASVPAASLLPGFDLTAYGMNPWPQSAATARQQGLQQILTLDSGVQLIQSANKVRQDAAQLSALLAGNVGGSLSTPFPGTAIGRQLHQVARLIRLRGSTGMQRQIFFCTLGGFDTHSSQSWMQWDLLRQLAEALAAFHAATVEMDLAQRVTAFTLSDFGRTLQPSGSGSDHGWGNHQLVLGGAVRGGQVYGSFPFPALGGPQDANQRGVLIPTTAVDQMGATLARWFGVPTAELPLVFPNLAAFPTSDLGFMA